MSILMSFKLISGRFNFEERRIFWYKEVVWIYSLLIRPLDILKVDFKILSQKVQKIKLLI